MTDILSDKPECSFEGCRQPIRGLKPWCEGHRQQQRRGEELRPLRPRFRVGEKPEFCQVDDCERRHFAQGWCRSHWQQNRDGEMIREIRSISRAPRRSERRIPPSGRGYYDADGYIRVSGHPDHPNAFPSSGKVSEHVLVMTEEIGRGLLALETVHHKNGQRDDNRLDNLELWSSAQPAGQRVEDKIVFAIEILELYRPDLLR